jgi:hypothetical protein
MCRNDSTRSSIKLFNYSVLDIKNQQDVKEEPMTKLEAVRFVVSGLKVNAVLVGCDPDPAGSSCTYTPAPVDVSILETLIDRRLNQNDLYFVTGSSGHPYYVPKVSILDDLKI